MYRDANTIFANTLHSLEYFAFARRFWSALVGKKEQDS